MLNSKRLSQLGSIPTFIVVTGWINVSTVCCKPAHTYVVDTLLEFGKHHALALNTWFCCHKHGWKLSRPLIQNIRFKSSQPWCSKYLLLVPLRWPKYVPAVTKVTQYVGRSGLNHLSIVGMLMWWWWYEMPNTTIPMSCRKVQCQHFILASGLVYMMGEWGSCSSLYIVTSVLCCLVMIELCCV